MNNNPKGGSRIKYFDHSRSFEVLIKYSEGYENKFDDIQKDIKAAYPRVSFQKETVREKNIFEVTTKGQNIFNEQNGDGIYKQTKQTKVLMRILSIIQDNPEEND